MSINPLAVHVLTSPPLQQHTLDPTTFSSINVVQFRQISNTFGLSHEPFNLLQILVMAATTTKIATPKAANGAGVKKAGAPKGGRVGKKNNARNAMAKMQAYCKFTTFDALRRVISTRLSQCWHAGIRDARTCTLLTNNNSQGSPRGVQGFVFQGAAARARQEGALYSAGIPGSRDVSRLCW